MMASESLRGHTILLLTDDYTHLLLDLDRVLLVIGAGSQTPVILASQTSLLHTSHPVHHTKSTSLATFIIFYNDPTSFLHLLDANTNWKPNYLVLLCLQPAFNATSVLNQPVVLRSPHLLLLHVKLQQRLLAYTNRPTRGHTFTEVFLGNWNPDKIYKSQSLFPPRLNDFGGYTMKVTMQCLEEPYLYFIDVENGICRGAYDDMLLIIGKKLNFIYTQNVHEELVWGYKKNGTWYGLIKDLVYKDRDIAASTMSLNMERQRDFDIIAPFLGNSFSLLLLRPPPLPLWQNILYPYSTLMWIMLLIATLTSAAVFAILLHYNEGFKDPFGIALQVNLRREHIPIQHEVPSAI
ncbi:hypothetical protein Pmani_019291 [Petrolisthes manimaculis]|uniref:Ionotropic glutamate receptor L-glutamate and glycine-binding domain-containing protein n=1 Tax=Petrolisthes manimaculis TaxID=1843537 RepID=A0AAE1PIP0_9EUCA|nr:hypothetical protein Pmani_019291 [Petrolisthes manimaculis]